MRIRIWSLLVLIVELLTACASSTLNEPRTNSAPVAASANTALALPTAYIIQQPIVNQVVPFTPTPALSSPTRSASISTPTIEPTEAPTDIAVSTSALGVTAAPALLDASATLANDPAMLEALLVTAINQVRVANGLPPYQHSPELSSAARAHSCDLASHGLISHESSDGRTLTQRLAGATPPWEWPSESIAAGMIDPAATVALWMDEPPEGWHRRNILDVDQREVGAGYCYVADDATGNHHYWTADFSRRSTT